MTRRNKLLLVFLIVETVIAFLIWRADFTFAGTNILEVYFFDIGQGDAIFMQLPDGNQILVDGGPSYQILSKLSQVMPFWDRSIDMVILTHPHADHVSGLIDVLDRYEIGAILESGVFYDTAEHQAWGEKVNREGGRRVIARQGQSFKIGQLFVMDVLAPLESFAGKRVSNPHDANIVLKVNYGQEKVLLTGDMEKGLELQMLSERNDVDVDVLKVGHHGSKTSSTQVFLERVSPELAIIQVGKGNRYGHPYQEVLDRFKSLNISLLRTDVDGDIELLVDANSLSVKK